MLPLCTFSRRNLPVLWCVTHEVREDKEDTVHTEFYYNSVYCHCTLQQTKYFTLASVPNLASRSNKVNKNQKQFQQMQRFGSAHSETTKTSNNAKTNKVHITFSFTFEYGSRYFEHTLSFAKTYGTFVGINCLKPVSSSWHNTVAL